MEKVEEIIAGAKDSGRLVVIDFTAQNCPPCKMIAPIYELLSEDFSDTIFLKVDVDKNPETRDKFEIDGWPTFVFIKDGVVQESIVGGTAAREGLYRTVSKYV